MSERRVTGGAVPGSPILANIHALVARSKAIPPSATPQNSSQRLTPAVPSLWRTPMPRIASVFVIHRSPTFAHRERRVAWRHTGQVVALSRT